MALSLGCRSDGSRPTKRGRHRSPRNQVSALIIGPAGAATQRSSRDHVAQAPGASQHGSEGKVGRRAARSSQRLLTSNVRQRASNLCHRHTSPASDGTGSGGHSAPPSSARRLMAFAHQAPLLQVESLRETSSGGCAPLCCKGQDERALPAPPRALAPFTPVFAIFAVRKALLLSLFESRERTAGHHAGLEWRAAHRPLIATLRR